MTDSTTDQHLRYTEGQILVGQLYAHTAAYQQYLKRWKSQQEKQNIVLTKHLTIGLTEIA